MPSARKPESPVSSAYLRRCSIRFASRSRPDCSSRYASCCGIRDAAGVSRRAFDNSELNKVRDSVE